MKRRASQGQHASRVLLERYGRSARERIYRRRKCGAPFAVFLIDGELTTVSYPSMQFSGLCQDHGASLVGIYTECPTIDHIVADLDEAGRMQRISSAAAIAA